MKISNLRIIRILNPANTYYFFERIVVIVKKVIDTHNQKRRMIEFYSNYVIKGNLCFDIGANIGNRTDIFLSLGATVVVVEPNPNLVNVLRAKYKNENKVIIVNKALGAKNGSGKLFLCEADTLSSMSKEWIDRTIESGRFCNYCWDKSINIDITTMDDLVGIYGYPEFCKIDVEGYEYQVIKGLSRQIQTISFEFTPERIDTAFSCIKHLNKLGCYKYNYSLGESMQLELNEWVNAELICEALKCFEDTKVFGDVYAKKTNYY